MTREDVEKQIDIIYEKLSKQLTLSENAVKRRRNGLQLHLQIC